METNNYQGTKNKFAIISKILFKYERRAFASNVNFVNYLQKMSDEYAEEGRETCHTLMECTIRRLVRYKGRNINFAQVDKSFLEGFIGFLDRESCSRREGDGLRQKPISAAYKAAIFSRTMAALNRAVREGIIMRNPGLDVEVRLRPRCEESIRCYLSMDEIRKIDGVRYSIDNDVKRAFLFCCFCGLRYSDLRKLSWSEIKETPDGRLQIETRMKKTGRWITVPLSENAISFLPENRNAGGPVFAKLPQQAGNADARLQAVIRRAGINKKVTFHVGRHTFATLALAYGADIYTVSKLLGHSSIRTTQVYAKIVDRTRRMAVDGIPKIK